MSNAAQSRATKSYRARLTQRGIQRFEVTARESDRDLIRDLAKRLVEDGPEAEAVRAAVKSAVVHDARKPSGILAALRRSPLAGIELDLTRARDEGRDVDL